MWTLIFYVSVGLGTASHGGPATIENFTTQATCETAGKQIKIDIPQTDWYKCVRYVK